MSFRVLYCRRCPSASSVPSSDSDTRLMRMMDLVMIEMQFSSHNDEHDDVGVSEN